MEQSDDERAAMARLRAAQDGSVRAFALQRRGNLTPEEQQAVRAANAEMDAATREMKRVMKEIKDRKGKTAA